MTIRVFSYDGSSYRKQLNELKSKENDRCYPVITLVLYFGRDEWIYGKTLYDCIDIPDKLLPFVNNYKMNFYSMKDLTSEKIEKFSSDFKVIAEFFMNMNNNDGQPKFSDRKLDHPQETLDLISVFSGDDRFTTTYNEMLNENHEGGVSMCEMIDRIEARGRAEGKAEGRAEGRSEIVKSLIAIGRSIKEIAEFFKTDESEIENMLAKD